MKIHYEDKYPAEQGPIVGNALSAAFAIGVLMLVAAFAVSTIVQLLS